MDAALAIAFVAAWPLLAAAFAWWTYKGLSTGRVTGPWYDWTIADQPGRFWLVIAARLACVALMILFTTGLVLRQLDWL
jgi:hypothetical protein